jgi:hypothetical protein
MFGLAHMDTTPFFYGVIIFLGIFSIVYKAKRGLYFAMFAEITVFFLVFKLHGGTMAGGFAATVAALIAGLVFPLMFRSKS